MFVFICHIYIYEPIEANLARGYFIQKSEMRFFCRDLAHIVLVSIE